MFECNANTDDFVGFKIKLYPTEEQKIKLNRNIELYRWVYNWCIDVIKENYTQTGKFIRYLELCNIYETQRKDPEFEWLLEFPLNSARIAIRSAIKAYIYFFSHRNLYPKYKSKRKSKQIFGVRGERVYLNDDGYMSIEGMGPGNKILYKGSSIPKDINLKELRVYNAWISFDKDDYYISFQIEYPRHYILENDHTDIIGIDVGLRTLATLSNGTEYNHPNVHKLRKRIKRLNKKMSKHYEEMIKQTQRTRTKFENLPKSKNLLKLETQFRKSHRKISNIHNTFIHTITKQIVETNPEAIVLETVSPKRMAMEFRKRNMRESASGIYAQNISKFFHYITYKAEERDIPIIRAEKLFPSSQICSNCGNRKKMDSSKTYKCDVCGLEIDRDLNAAINLREYGRSRI